MQLFKAVALKPRIIPASGGQKGRVMKRTHSSLFIFGLVMLIAAGAAAPARADAFSFGLGVSNGDGGFFSLGLSNMGHGGGHHGRHGGHYGPAPIVCAPHPVYCAPRPVYCAPRPVVCLPPPVVVAPAPVVYAQPAPVVQTVVVNSGYWQEREERVWVEGVWIETLDAYGRRCKQWQPGRWEVRRTREWVQ
jgi:hypothetical protein